MPYRHYNPYLVSTEVKVRFHLGHYKRLQAIAERRECSVAQLLTQMAENLLVDEAAQKRFVATPEHYTQSHPMDFDPG